MARDADEVRAAYADFVATREAVMAGERPWSSLSAHFTDDAVIYDTNHPPVRTAAAIGRFWDKIRSQWHGAVWSVDRVVSDGRSAAIEWTMGGTGADGPFRLRGSEHYAFAGDRIAEIRQYWIFDTDRLDTGLVDYPYPEEGSE